MFLESREKFCRHFSCVRLAFALVVSDAALSVGFATLSKYVNTYELSLLGNNAIDLHLKSDFIS